MNKPHIPTSIQGVQNNEQVKRFSRHPLIVPVITFVVLFFASLVAFILFNGTTIGPGDARVVNIYVDGEKQTFTTRAKSVGELLKRRDIKLNPGDEVEPKKSTQIFDDNFTVNVYRARPVTIVSGSKRITVLSAEQSPRGVARQVGIKLEPEDIVRQSTPENILSEGVIVEKLVVDRSTPVKLVLYGQAYSINTHAKTVGQLIDEKGINIKGITVFPKASTRLKKNSVVFVTYPGKKIVVSSETVPFTTQTVSDPDLAAGQTVVKEAGSPGKKVVIYEIDKKTKKRRVLKIVVAAKPVKRVVANGTKVAASTLTGSKADWIRAAGIDASQASYVDYVISHESGWNPASVSANRCVGLGQRCDASILINACPSWQTDPVCQLRHFTEYANGRYGSWQGAYNAWQVQGWW